jgi:hypothetical protein
VAEGVPAPQLEETRAAVTAMMSGARTISLFIK